MRPRSTRESTRCRQTAGPRSPTASKPRESSSPTMAAWVRVRSCCSSRTASRVTSLQRLARRLRRRPSTRRSSSRATASPCSRGASDVRAWWRCSRSPPTLQRQSSHRILVGFGATSECLKPPPAVRRRRNRRPRPRRRRHRPRPRRRRRARSRPPRARRRPPRANRRHRRHPSRRLHPARRRHRPHPSRLAREAHYLRSARLSAGGQHSAPRLRGSGTRTNCTR